MVDNYIQISMWGMAITLISGMINGLRIEL
jgi:F0F1-type ATP synthase assembly protein I